MTSWRDSQITYELNVPVTCRNVKHQHFLLLSGLSDILNTVMFSGSVVSPWDSSAHIRTVSRFVGVEKKAPFFTRMNTFLCRCSMFNEQQVSSSHGHISSRLRSDLSPGHRIAVRRLWTTWLKARSVYKSYKWILPALVSVQTHWVFFFRSTSPPSERSQVQIPQRLFITVTPSARWSVNALTGPQRFCCRPDFI